MNGWQFPHLYMKDKPGLKNKHFGKIQTTKIKTVWPINWYNSIRQCQNRIMGGTGYFNGTC